MASEEGYSKPTAYEQPEKLISVVDNTGEATPAEPQPRKPLPIIKVERHTFKGNSTFV